MGNDLCEEKPGNRCYNHASKRLERITQALALKEQASDSPVASDGTDGLTSMLGLIHERNEAEDDMHATQTGIRLLEAAIQESTGSAEERRVLEKTLSKAKALHKRRRLALTFSSVNTQKMADEVERGVAYFSKKYPFPRLSDQDISLALERGLDTSELNRERVLKHLERKMKRGGDTLTDEKVKALADKYHLAQLDVGFRQGMIKAFNSLKNTDTIVDSNMVENIGV